MKPPLTGAIKDDYQTPAYALNPLYPYLRGDMVIWECACGAGNLVDALQSRGYEAYGTDVLTGQDFLTWEPDCWDVVITNPPFSLKHEFLKRAYSLGKPFAFLLPLTALDTGERQKLFRDHGIEIILFDKRVHFEIPSKNIKSKSWFSTAWFTWGLNIGKQLTFAHYHDDEQLTILTKETQ